ncbi:carboxynorspermidine decarboxylase [Paenibacillus eucommiae]|uniref:Carboxynorspermidine decarboxylase n=1 Tax=Paenibacillus eucommiae TaxID=1355755 RepID=A0ABS4J305_9BACL|nr:carboxynorspermidine decarboxylase [Paenibacillus eucommiae]MBP1994236.1 carboxynorspermidine decarboxylase [Paenibacillus eucommiae]
MRIEELPTPCFVVDEAAIEKNLKILNGVMQRTGAKIILAQKAFSMTTMYPLIGEYLSGTTASGLFEARLGYEEMGKENHVFAPAYREDEIDEIISICDHIIFNSFSQLEKFKDKALAAGKKVGLRVNPECSTQVGHEIYDPCSTGSRFGTKLEDFRPELLDGVSGLHFHTLCQQNSDDLATTLQAFEAKFGKWLPQMDWVNFGGGHHITRDDYDIATLEACIKRMQDLYGLEVYLEPGEAVALNAGYLIASVLDFHKNGIDIAILDTSATCHMPDVLEMPYRPPLIGSGQPDEKPFTYRLGGQTCLTGDVIGDYSFDEPLQCGDRLVFGDMAIYSMVKTNTFNGMPLPAIAVQSKDGSCQIVRQFGYQDFKLRLA